MIFYARMAATALRLLTKYGQSVTITRTTGATYSPTTGAYTGGATTTITGYAAAIPWSQRGPEQHEQNEIHVILEATSTAPEVNDKILINSIGYKITEVNPINPAGTAVAYELRCVL